MREKRRDPSCTSWGEEEGGKEEKRMDGLITYIRPCSLLGFFSSSPSRQQLALLCPLLA